MSWVQGGGTPVARVLSTDQLTDAHYHHAPELVIVPDHRISKRLSDIVFALVLLVVLFPVLLITAIAVLITSSGPVLFRQERIGLGGRTFSVFKFRTMDRDAENLLATDPALGRHHRENGFKLPPGEDPRVTPLGNLLRRTSLDELPQLFNVIRGDMSLVGPRPVVADELPLYEEWLGSYLAVRPGLTGLWQVEGRSDIDFPERAMLDAKYVAQSSFWFDLKLLLRTIPAVLRGSGAH